MFFRVLIPCLDGAMSFVFNGTRVIAWLFPILAGGMNQNFGSVSRGAMTVGLIYVLGLI